MNCIAIDNITDYYIDNKLTESLKRKVDKHLESCPRCSKEVCALLRMKKLMGNYAKIKSPEGLKENIFKQAYSTDSSKTLYFKFKIKLSLSYGFAMGYLILMLIFATIPFGGIPTQNF